MIDRPITRTEGEVLELLQALIRNRCVNDGSPASGHEARSVATLEAYFGASGEVVEPAPGRQSVVYRIPGSDPAAPCLLLMGHLDVVPVTEEGWSVDPFGAEVIDGMVWGRGAVDMLNLTAAMAVVFKPYLTGESPSPPGGLVYLAVADEEQGGGLGAGWLMDHRPGLIECDYVLTEVAFPAIRSPGQPPVHPVKVAEKGPSWRIIRGSGVPSHGSQPYGTDNAVVKVAEAIVAIARSGSPVEITPEWRGFVEGVGWEPARVAALLDPDLVDAEIELMATEDPLVARWAHACTHLTLSPNLVSGGTKANTVADRADTALDIRVLPGQTDRTIDDHLRKVLGPLYDEVDVESVIHYPANSSAADGPLWEAIGDAYESMTGSRRIVPTMTPATTDARFFRAKGVKAYGVGLFDDRVPLSDFLGMFHGNDERIGVGSLGLTAELLSRIIQRLPHRAGNR